MLWSVWCTFYVFKWGIYQGSSTTNNWLLSFFTAIATDVGQVTVLQPMLASLMNVISIGVCIRLMVMGSVRQQTRHANHIASLNLSMSRSTRTVQQPKSAAANEENSNHTMHGSVDEHGSVLITMPSLSELNKAASQSAGAVARQRDTKLAKVLPKRTKARFCVEL
jgi:hypothetical protein